MFIDFSNHDKQDVDRRLTLTNIFYVVVFILVGILCFILYNTGYSWLGKLINTKYTGKKEIGVSLVCRTTLSLAFWFLIHSLIMIHNHNLVDSWQFRIHSSWLWLHLVIYLGMWAGFWFIPDDLFNFYMKAAIYISGVYLIIKIIFLLYLFHAINDMYAEKHYCLLLVATIIITCISITGFVLGYYIFGRGDCKENVIIISINIGLAVILYIISLIFPKGSIFVSSLVFIYTCYLTLSGMICQPSCNSISKHGPEITFSIIASIFTILVAGGSTFTTTTRFTKACSCSDKEQIFSLSFFHAVFALASVYLTMIVTDWGLTEEQVPWTVSRGDIAMWVNEAAAWTTHILYAWMLIAPMACPNRDFSG